MSSYALENEKKCLTGRQQIENFLMFIKLIVKTRLCTLYKASIEVITVHYIKIKEAKIIISNFSSLC